MNSLLAGALLAVPALTWSGDMGEHFRTPKLLAGEGLAFAAVMAMALRAGLVRGALLDWIWLPAVLAAAVSASQSANGLMAVEDLLRLLAFAATYALFRRAPRPGRLAGVLLAAGAVNAVMAIAQAGGWRMGGLVTRAGRHAVYGTFGNPNFLAEFLAPVAVIAGGEMLAAATTAGALAAGALIPLLGGALLLTVSRAGWLGLMTGGLVAALAAGRALRQAQGGSRRLLWSGAACAVVAISCWSPLAVRIGSTLGTDDPGLATRRFMWTNALAQFRDHPWLGTGPGGYGDRYLEYTIRLREERNLKPRYPGITREAHADGLQLLAERGLLGAIAWGAAFAWLAMTALRRLRALRDAERLRSAAALGAAVAVLAESCFGFPMRVFPTAALLLWALARAAPGGGRREPGSARGVAAVAAAAALWFTARSLGAESALGAGAAAGPRGEHALRAGLRLLPGHGELRFRLGIALLNQGRTAEAIPEFEAAARRLHDPDAEFNLGLIALKEKRWADAVPHFRAGLAAYPDFNPAPYADLAEALAGLKRFGEARDAAVHALTIDPGFARARALLDRIDGRR